MFLILAAFHFLCFYLFIGTSTINKNHNDQDFFGDQFFNYSLAISLILTAIWFTYWILRKKLISQKLIWIHIVIVFIIVFILPVTLLYPPMPRRYYDYSYDSKILLIFSSMARNFTLTGLALILSELLLVININLKKPKVIS